MSEVFHGCVASARQKSAVLSSGKIARDPTVYFGKYGIVGNLLDCGFFFFFFLEAKEMMEELIFLENWK